MQVGVPTELPQGLVTGQWGNRLIDSCLLEKRQVREKMQICFACYQREFVGLEKIFQVV